MRPQLKLGLCAIFYLLQLATDRAAIMRCKKKKASERERERVEKRKWQRSARDFE